ncbi:CCAAT-box DNA binding protein subunit b [Plakobranchus ocellatus]|uniref:CCAAT-box DNA binding protein subunit b n=1 Tax=Plakobranchus ocellatus TaxID=259542 RepID=A0AAV4D7P4_9GAST|nr:CCAAT-box DNA binding protein subunit b [Plakobranchus ocellatus]
MTIDSYITPGAPLSCSSPGTQGHRTKTMKFSSLLAELGQVNVMMMVDIDSTADSTFRQTEGEDEADSTFRQTEGEDEADSTFRQTEVQDEADSTFLQIEGEDEADSTFRQTEVQDKVHYPFRQTEGEDEADSTFRQTEDPSPPSPPLVSFSTPNPTSFSFLSIFFLCIKLSYSFFLFHYLVPPFAPSLPLCRDDLPPNPLYHSLELSGCPPARITLPYLRDHLRDHRLIGACPGCDSTQMSVPDHTEDVCSWSRRETAGTGR